jgi:hypothetical protein
VRSACCGVGIEAVGHDHRPLTATGVLPADWQLVELNPALVTAQRRANGQRTVKTNQVDLAAICDLLRAGHPLRVCARQVSRVGSRPILPCAQASATMAGEVACVGVAAGDQADHGDHREAVPMAHSGVPRGEHHIGQRWQTIGGPLVRLRGRPPPSRDDHGLADFMRQTRRRCGGTSPGRWPAGVR